MRAVKKIEALVAVVRGFMLLVVFASIVFMVTAIVQEMIREYLLRDRNTTPTTKTVLTEEQERDIIIRSAGRRWMADGTVHLIRYLGSGGSIYLMTLHRSVEVYDTDLNLLWSGNEGEIPYSYLSGSEPYDRWRGFYFTGAEFFIDFSQSFVVPVVSAERTRIENWRYVPSGEYFTGYNGKTGAIGYLGADGFCSKKGKVRGFGKIKWASAWAPRDSYTPKLLWQSDKVLWEMNFEERRVEKLYESTSEINDIRLYGWRDIEAQKGLTLIHEQQSHQGSRDIEDKDASLRGAILICERQGRHLIINDPRQVITIKLPAEYSKIYHHVTVLRDGNDFYVQVTGMKGAPADRNNRVAMVDWLTETRGKDIDNWEELHRLDGSGELKLVARNEWTKPAVVKQERQGPRERAEEFKKYTTAATPIFLRPISTWRVEVRNNYYDDYGNFMRGVDEILIYTAPVNIFYCLVLSFVSVCVAFYHGWGRQRSVGGLVGWLVFVGIFNIAGLLTYLAMNHRPVIKCSECGKKRHLMGDPCIRCGSGLPVPERKETDLVFAG